MNPISLLKSRPLIFDGGMGTMLQAAGLPAGALPESWNLERPEVVEQIHLAYLQAGCDIITTNTFGANALKMELCGLAVDQVASAAVAAAKRAIERYGQPDRLIAFDIGPTGKLLKPLGDLEFERAVELFGEMARAGERAGADFIHIETMSDTLELKAAVLAAKECTQLPVTATVIFDESGKLLTGGDAAGVVAMLEGLGVAALGMNCGLGPVQMTKLLPELLARASVPVIVNPNAGMPVIREGKTCFEVGPEEFAATMEELAELGAAFIGGCCGTTPEHIRAVAQRCSGIKLKPFTAKNETVISSYGRSVSFDNGPIVIGERINPTGKPRLKQALREGDLEYILTAGISQQQAGAQVLDVNVGLPGIDERQAMVRVVTELQGVVDAPLQIDTASSAVMEAALRVYNGKALVNSVNGKRESMEAVFPLVAKYGGVVVGLTLDEAGIPETAEGRLAVAKKIVDTARQYGIDKKDIMIDTLTMTISSIPDAARVTLDALELVRRELGVKTVLGVSNVSFGLPCREFVNAAFYTMALERGLGAAILNPNAEAMMNAYHAFRALWGYDEKCADYIGRYSGVVPETRAAAGDCSLRDAILRGLRERSRAAAGELLSQGQEPLAIISQELVPALDEVGRGFENKTVFLPQLLMSADAAREAFEALKASLAASGEKQPAGEKIVLATVKGDIHDIGKNIVKVLLENYGFQVIDLGRDVAPERVVDAALENGVRLVGLSALMTTTVESMAQTIHLLRERAPGVRVMVGGAVLTADYAGQIGADFYGRDAMSSVRYAEELFEKK
ncbi:homocysteine S-methyltransferase family protein [Feifania hominis]|uniref:Methionine synthase n=1 Tax=Feifania hominis TaxID=2763660 RepID=A0A926DD68_9FIRM|nr:homocysteine S-methyltransferase family protein [Feifania hominis]MBC8535676.1 homocysteine S-methyltransferase family protein [Feifania hominis]